MTLGPEATRSRVFVLSPASLSGARGRRILRGEAVTPALRPLEKGGVVPLAEVYAAISTLYFRGKLSYARRFARWTGSSGSAVLAITPTRGVMAVDAPVSLAELCADAGVDIDSSDASYARALDATCRSLHDALPPDGEVVLLGSIATTKYLEPLAAVFGPRLLVPRAFIGRGDMSRGGLLLRAVESGEELEYDIALTAPRRGARPPRLGPRA